jgi:magnesium-transporting ATPase (P-type)
LKMENLFSNKFLFLGIFYGFLLLLFAIYLPALQRVLNTRPLELWQWAIVFGIGILTTILLEILKAIFAKNKKI